MNEEHKAAKILVVDDDQDVRLLMGVRLRKSGYDVVTAEDGEEAVRIVRQAKPDLILLDLGLPKMDGYEVCRTLKSDPETCGIPIIILSAKSQQTDREQALAAGAESCMAKPFNPVVVLEAIRHLLESRVISSG
jgi:CheY-like chemotaxis protein